MSMPPIKTMALNSGCHKIFVLIAIRQNLSIYGGNIDAEPTTELML